MQYVSKFGKLSGGHRAGKGQLSFQSQRREMPKNAQTTEQLQAGLRSTTPPDLKPQWGTKDRNSNDISEEP